MQARFQVVEYPDLQAPLRDMATPAFTPEQLIMLFDKQCKREDAKAAAEALREERKAEAEALRIEAKAIRDEERAQELHDAQITALGKGSSQEKHTESGLEFEDEGEISEETRILTKHLPGIRRTYLIAITKNKFPAENLCKLIPGSSDNGGTTTEIIGGKVITRRVKESVKSYGQDMSIWTAGFLKYICALSILHPQDALLPLKMILFITAIHEFEKDYRQSAVLTMVLEFHNTLIDEQKHIDPESWVLPLEVQHRFLTHAQVKTISRNPAKQAPTSLTTGVRLYEENGPAVICTKFHTPTGCNYRGCKRTHQKPCPVAGCSGAHTSLV